MKNLFYYATILLLTAGCTPNSTSPIDMDRWLVVNNNETIESANVTLNEGDRAIFKGETTSFDNFELSGDFMLNEGAQAALMLHTDSDMTKGYEVFFGNGPIDGQIKSGSLTGVRNLFKSLAKDGAWSPFAIKVSGRRITVEIEGDRVVDYIEPDSSYRAAEYAQRLLASGNFAILCNRGDVEFRDLKVTTLNDPQQLDKSRRISEDGQIMRLQHDLFPLIDYHVHLKGISKEEAYEQSLENGINYGIAPNCGIGFPITTDRDIEHYRDSTKNMPFLFGMQGEGREWPTTFSKESQDLFDYVFTDALTFDDHNGRRTKLWIDSLVHIDIPVERYVDMLIDRSVKVISSEPLDIFVNPTLLPREIRALYDELWTESRMDTIIKTLKENDVALEINDRYEIPSIKFLKRAKRAGLKFTFGTNNVTAEDLRGLKYALRAAREVGLTKEDMWNPSMKNDHEN
ncbi:MAG: family 16 glycoside hydrolase [Rikenellaceae bacterium]